MEVFFSALRSRGGFNNNPNAIQFRSAYKRLLVRHEISGSMYGNCTLLDSSSILFVGANTKVIHADSICTDIIENSTSEEGILFEEFEHDYDYHMPGLEEYVVDVVTYTSGFIVKKIRQKKDFCNICDSLLVEHEDKNTSLLLKLKNRSNLINVSSNVRKICLAAEYMFRFYTNDLMKKQNIKQMLCSKTINEVSEDTSIFNCETMKTHILNQCVFDNHRN